MHFELPNKHTSKVKDNVLNMQSAFKIEYILHDRFREKEGFVVINHDDILNLFNYCVKASEDSILLDRDLQFFHCLLLSENYALCALSRKSISSRN